MPDVAELTIKVNSNRVVKADKDLKRFNTTSRKADKATSKLGGSFAALAGKVGLAAGATAALWSTFNNLRTFQKLNAQLNTAVGSAEGADIAFAQLQNTAKEMPNTLEEITQAFITLKNLGLDPSEDALLSYGNTAAAMGKTLDQFIQAVADATTKEFERLKEFGIRASQEGDRVKFTFQGITTEIGNNAAEIEAFLQDLGDVQFAGSMAAQMDTINGQLSLLSDAWFQFTTAIADGGIGDGIGSVLGGLTSALNGLTETQRRLALESKLFDSDILPTVADLDALYSVIEVKERSITGIRDEGRKATEAGIVTSLKELAVALERKKLADTEKNDLNALNEKRIIGAQAVADQEQAILSKYLPARERMIQIAEEEIAIEEKLFAGKFANAQTEIDQLNKLQDERTKLVSQIQKDAEIEIRTAQRLKEAEERIQQEKLIQRQNFYSDLFTIAKDGNSNLFKLSRGLAIADATIQGVKAVQQAWGSAPFPANIPAVAFTTAETLANVQRIKGVGNYASGGIVPGSSFSGDTQQANVNSGEMILNRMQQANLFKQANGGGSGMNVVIQNTFSEASVTAEQDDNGQLIIQVTQRAISGAVSTINQDLSRGDGPTSRAFKTAFARERR